MMLRQHTNILLLVVLLLCVLASAQKDPTNSSIPAPDTNGGRSMIEYINKIRRKQGLNPTLWSPKLAQNAYKTGQATGGKTMRHKLFPGSSGQVLVPGFSDSDVCTKNLGGYTSFELYYTSWLCEVASDKALEGKCPTVLRMSKIASGGQTGHYRLLSGKNMKSIGCAFYRDPGAAKCGSHTGIWGCDLGM